MLRYSTRDSLNIIVSGKNGKVIAKISKEKNSIESVIKAFSMLEKCCWNVKKYSLEIEESNYKYLERIGIYYA